MLTRKELSALYGKIETKFNRAKKELLALEIEPEAFQAISETLSAQQLIQVKALHDEPEIKKA